MIVVAGCLVIKDSKVLMVKEGKDICLGKWNTPAGKVEVEESFAEAAIRETFEETGCRVKLTGVLPIYKKKIPILDDSLLLVRFTAEIIEENLKIDNPKEILDVKWLNIDEVKKMTEKELRGMDIVQAIKNFEENKIYPLGIFE